MGSASGWVSAGLCPVAIVTGANTGIGRACALALAAAGFDVGITWQREEERVAEVIAHIRAHGVRAAATFLELDPADGAPEVIDALAEELGGLDAFVNNAGRGIQTPVLEVTLAQWRAVLETNLTGAFLCAQTAARRMVAAGHGGAIVNVTSVHEHIPLRLAAPYTASKHGLGGLTQALALELGVHGIRVNSVGPGQIATALSGQEHQQPREMAVPLGRAGRADEIGALVAWLCSDAASYVTGASYVADGGLGLIAAEHQNDML